MARHKKKSKRRSGAGNDLRKQRLALIKKRHKELILNPREELMDGLLEEDDALHSLDEPEEFQIIEEYGLKSGL